MNIKIGILSIVACSLLTGCFTTEHNVSNFDYKEVHKKNRVDSSAVQIIKTKSYFNKNENLNHNIPNDVKLDLYLKDTSLADLTKYIPYDMNIDKEIQLMKIKSLSHTGDLVTLLNKITEMTNTFWTYENNVIKIVKTKTIVYKFPMFSAEKLNLVFNISQDGNDNFNVSSITTDIFDEMKVSLDAAMSEYIVENSYEEKSEKNLKNTKENNNQKQNIQNDEELDQLIKSIAEGSNEESKLGELNRNVENGNSTNNKNDTNGFKRTNAEATNAKTVTPQVPGATPQKQPLLNYDINKENTVISKLENMNNVTKDKENRNSNSVVKEGRNNNENSNRNTTNNKLENNDNNSDEEITKIANIYKRIINPNQIKVSVLKESGMVVVNVDKNTEMKVDTIIRSIVENVMSNMVVLDLYIVEANKEKVKALKSNLTGRSSNSSGFENGIVADGNGMVFSRNIIQDIVDGNTPGGDTLSMLIGYTTENKSSRVLSNPKILSIPNVPSRIKSTVDHPYLEINSLGGTDEGPDMSIGFINEGTDIALLSNVYGEDGVFLSLGVKLNKYLGDKSISAGTLGTFDVPIQSPRTLNTSFRMNAGDIFILGGMNSFDFQDNTNMTNLIMPTNVGSSYSESELLIIASPRIIRYVQE